jgi:hypothetical protein
MLLGISLSKKLECFSEHNTYTSIYNLPQWNWTMVHKSGNLSYLKKLHTYRNIGEDQSKELEEIWYQIYDEFIEEFGLSKEYRELIEKKKRIAQMKNDYIQTEDGFLLTLIDIEEIEFNSTFDKSEGLGYEAMVVAIEKRQGMAIDPRTLTVYKYNNYIRTLKAEKNG